MSVSMKNLLEAGVHFGHQTRRWNPKMKPYIFTERNGIYILDLKRTLQEVDAAYRFVRDITARGGYVLLVGTKKQAQDPIRREAERAGQPYVNQRWLGGMLTNFVTIRGRIKRMLELEQMEESGALALRPKKEALLIRRELVKLQRDLNGIRDMADTPKAVFVVDTKREAIAVKEARRLDIPLIGLVDTNADPDEVDYVIPGNDDAIRSVSLICRVIADAAIDGRRAAGLPVPGDEVDVAPVAEETAPVAAEAIAPTPEAPVAEPAVEAPVTETEAPDDQVDAPVADAEAPAEA
ncbi:MAG: 30S ribosomal protein S2 [Coriobacteriia bacterium]|nr:30S ribosomal protein S2 [Coriobacteriia bacterium]